MSVQAEDLLHLNQQMLVVQDLIRRCKKRTRRGNLSLFGALALAALAVVGWLLIPPGSRFLPVFLAVLMVAALLAYATFTKLRPGVLLHSAEKRFTEPAGISDWKNLPELELEFSLLREARRSRPALSAIDYQSQFKDDVLFYIEEQRANGSRNRNANHVVQVTTIVGSLAATAVSSLSYAFNGIQWMTIILTFVVGVASGLAAYFKYKDRSFYAQQTANAIEQELTAYRLHIARYKRIEDPEEAQIEFLQEVHRLQVEQKNREQNLDEPTRKTAEGD